MSDYIKKIRTKDGDKQIDYNALANLPTFKTINGVSIKGSGDISLPTKAELALKQALLVSGSNIKTINGINILGSGNLELETGSVGYSEVAKALVNQWQYQMYGPKAKIEDNIVDIILFAGQSNMCGRAQLSDDANLGYLLDVNIEHGFTYGTGSTKTKITEPISANGSSGYGLVPSFINSYYYATNRKVCACFKSTGGTMMNKFLPYTYDSDGNEVATPTTYYKSMVSQIENAKTRLASDGYTLGGIFLVWLQGESDAEYYGYSNNYANSVETNLTEYEDQVAYYMYNFINLKEALKIDTGLNKAFIIRIGHRNNNATDTLYSSVIDAQNRLGKIDDDIVLVSTILAGAKKFKRPGSTEIVNLMRDGWHYFLEMYNYAGIEAGINSAIYVNSNYQAKPILYEYNSDYLKAIEKYVPLDHDFTLEEYLYIPNTSGFYDLMKYAVTKTISISFNISNYSGLVASNTQLEVNYNPSNATDKGVTYKSSDENVAKVDENGMVLLIGEGTAIITATLIADEWIQCEATINVSNTDIPVDSVILDKTTYTLYQGATVQLSATVLPTTATKKEIIWETSDSAIATVVDGLVTAIDMGDVTITARSVYDNTKYASCKINISAIPEDMVSMDFTEHDIDYYVEQGVIEITNDTKKDQLTYDDNGLHWADGALPYGVRLKNAIENVSSNSIRLSIEMKVDAYANSGTTQTSNNYEYCAILSNDGTTEDHAHSSSCLAPCILDFKLQLQTRLQDGITTQTNINSFFVHDGAFHKYVIELDGTTLRGYRDGTLISETKSVVRSGVFKTIFGIHQGYNYAGQFALDKGYHIKTFKIESL